MLVVLGRGFYILNAKCEMFYLRRIDRIAGFKIEPYRVLYII